MVGYLPPVGNLYPWESRTIMKPDIELEGGFPPGIARPALRALEAAGITRLEQLVRVRQVDLLKLHGMGPKAAGILQAALQAKGLSFANPETPPVGTGQLRVIGAGLLRTATNSLALALEQLIGGLCHQMSAIPGHPFNLGPGWNTALSGGTPDWSREFKGFTAAVDWPASMFWRQLSRIYPDALVILSRRDSARTWWESANETILPVARLALDPGWSAGRNLVRLLERFVGGEDWGDAQIMMAAYKRHNAEVRNEIPPARLLEWQAQEGWAPLCNRLGLPVPVASFPWINRREDWG